MYIKIKRSKKLFYHVVVKGKNGETVFTSETYFSKGNAHRAALLASKKFDLPIK